LPERLVDDPFGATLYVTVPFPLPGDPPLIVIHETPLEAVHVQPPATETETDPGPPPEATVTPDADSVGVQTTPAWLTVNTRPAIDSVAFRELVLVFAATL
jgi:hypothetical protein